MMDDHPAKNPSISQSTPSFSQTRFYQNEDDRKDDQHEE